jgi:hypothetical protein
MRIFAALMVSLVGCGCETHRDAKQPSRAVTSRLVQLRTVHDLRAAFAAGGLSTYLTQRDSDLVGPPVVKGCDPPLVVSGKAFLGYGVLYVCPTRELAARARVEGLPGRRIRSGNIVAVAIASPRFESLIAAVVKAVTIRQG